MNSEVISSMSVSNSIFEAHRDANTYLNEAIKNVESKYCHVRVSQPALQVLTGDKYIVIMAVTIEYGKEIACQPKYT